MLYTLLRCQRPVIITVPGLLAALSFECYSSVSDRVERDSILFISVPFFLVNYFAHCSTGESLDKPQERRT